jgi:glycosyltransferase involved in cell wall biosynthesis
MKVLHLATSAYGGAGRAAVRLNTSLKSIGLDSTLVTRDGVYEEEEIDKSGSQLSILLKTCSSASTYLQSRIVQKDSRLVTPISIPTFNLKSHYLEKADVIHIHATYNFISMRQIQLLSDRKIPIFVTMHDQRIMTGGCHYSGGCLEFQDSCRTCPQVKFVFRKLIQKSFNLQNQYISEKSNIHYISPSEWLKDLANSSEILSDKLISVVKNPIPNTYFEELKAVPYHEELRIGFSSVDLNSPYKGISILVKAINKCKSVNPNLKIKLYLIGKGHISGLSEDVEVIQREISSDAEMASTLRLIDILVIPSTQDNSPSVVGEALACGLDVIGSNVGGIPELLNVFNMPVFENGDWESLAEILGTFKPVNSRTLVQDKARKLFGMDQLAEEFRNLYESAVDFRL